MQCANSNCNPQNVKRKGLLRPGKLDFLFYIIIRFMAVIIHYLLLANAIYLGETNGTTAIKKWACHA